jgi:2-keto-4-pentenoate hydratase/2-oxohepta-3-ene-1,7-dioic acid hydratase in catechol pathway
MLFSVDEIIAYISRFCTLKTGDLIFTGTPAGSGPARIGTHLKGYIGDDKVLDFHVR